MKLTQTIVVALLSIAVLTGCKKNDVSGDIEDCITGRIEDAKDNVCLQSIYSYNYQAKTVYFFAFDCPEGCYSLLDKDCNQIKDTAGNSVCYCHWGGAFCSDDFWTNKTNETLIWQRL